MKGWILTLSLIANLVFAPILTASAASHSESSFSSLLHTNPDYSALMLNENTHLLNQKQLSLLKARKQSLLENNMLYFGVKIISLLDYQTSNDEDKFGWLMRHPTANNQIGKKVSEAALHSVQFETTATLPTISVYANLLYDPQQSFGSGTITSLTRNQTQIRKAYVLVGDLTKSPFFFTLGKFQAPFGLMDSVDPFTSSTLWHAFSGLAYGAKISFYQSGLNVALELAQGGSQFRALNTTVKDSAVPSRLNNPIFDISYHLFSKPNHIFLIGGSYERGSAYCQDFPVTHFNPCEKNNPAYDFYTQYQRQRLTLQAEFARTLHVWPGTHNPQPPLNQFSASKVTAFDLGAKYGFLIDGQHYTLSGSFGQFIAGPSGSPWHRQNQSVLGLSTVFFPHTKLFAEIIHVQGYVPLNFISGSLAGAPFPAGTTHSRAGTNNTIFTIGFDVTV